MPFNILISFLAIATFVSSAALNQAREIQSQPSLNQQACAVAITIHHYLTVTVSNTTTTTVTDYPDAVTIVNPDYVAISSSLASAGTIDSLVVVESSQNRPLLAPQDTSIPTFVKSISAPAAEYTEAPHLGTSVFYVPGTRPTSSILFSLSTESIIFSQTEKPTASTGNFTAPAGGWNGTHGNATEVPPVLGTGVTVGRDSTRTETVFVSTIHFVTNITISADNPVPTSTEISYSGYEGHGDNAKRHVCTLVSAYFNGIWGYWCNNYGYSTTYTWTDWTSTVTPGNSQEPLQSATATVSTSSTSTDSITVTVSNTSPSTTRTFTVVPVPSGGPNPPTNASACNQPSAFNIGFDDLPAQSVFDNNTAGLPPFPRLYKHFEWDAAWSYLPPPNDPYPPHNGRQLAVYVPPRGTPQSLGSNTPSVPFGGFGAGSRNSDDAYWFSAHSMWFGCDNNVIDTLGGDICDFYVEGYEYDIQTKTNRIISTQHYNQSLCHSQNCQLQQIVFGPELNKISALGFYAKIGGGVYTFYVDSIELSWWNNDCDAQKKRSTA